MSDLSFKNEDGVEMFAMPDDPYDYAGLSRILTDDHAGWRTWLELRRCPACGHEEDQHSAGGMCSGHGTVCHCVRMAPIEDAVVEWRPSGLDSLRDWLQAIYRFRAGSEFKTPQQLAAAVLDRLPATRP